MKPSRATLVDLAAKHRFGAVGIEIVCHLLDVLEAVDADAELRARLVLKGGTALNLMRDPPPRLSVDLDFNDIGAVDRDEMLAERPRVLAAVERVGRRLGYRVQASPPSHAGCKFVFRGPSAVAGAVSLKVDLNFVHRVPLGPPRSVALWTPLGDRPVVARIVSHEELVAGKLIALLDRTAARDLFDVARLADDPLPVSDAARLRTVFIAASVMLPHALHTYGLDRLDRVSDADISANLVPLLREDAAQDALRWRTSAARFVGPLLDLSPQERRFVDDAQRGAIDVSSLADVPPDLAAAIAAHPAIRWKATNAARHNRAP